MITDEFDITGCERHGAAKLKHFQVWGGHRRRDRPCHVERPDAQLDKRSRIRQIWNLLQLSAAVYRERTQLWQLAETMDCFQLTTVIDDQ